MKWGASPRGAQTLVLGARVHALLNRQPNASLAGVRAAALPALRHRLGRSFEAEAEGLSADDLVAKILGEVPEVEGKVAAEAGR